MAWYITGTVTVTNGQQIVTGAGTDFVSNVLAGQAFVSSDGKPYEIQQVVSATVLMLRTSYLGATVAGAGYGILPTQSLIKDLADQAAALIGSFAAVRDGIGAGLMADGTVAAPGLRFAQDQDTGMRRANSNLISMVTSGVDRLYIGANGVGIGGTSAAPDGRSALLIQGTDQSTAGLADGGAHGASLMLRANGTTVGDGGALLFATTFSVGGAPFGAIKGMVTDGSGASRGDMAFATRALSTDGALTERMRLTAGGYLSLGAGATAYAQQHIQGASQSVNELPDYGAQGGSLFLQDSTANSGSGGALLLGAANGSGTPFAYVRGSLVDASGRSSGSLMFGTRAGANASTITPRYQITRDGHLMPAADNTYDVGGGGNRVRTLYAATGSINTSDARMKQQIGEMPDEWLDAWGAVRHVRFKFNDAVAEKGDAARWHLGFIAQEIKAAFDAKGIDATTIGLLCHDSWAEESEPEIEEMTRTERRPRFTPSATLVDADGKPLGTWDYDEVTVTDTRPTGKTKVTREAGERWSLRYDECQALESAWQRREITALRAAVTALQSA